MRTLMISTVRRSLPADQVLPQLGQDISVKLASFGAESLELSSGVNLDLSSEDCTMPMSPLFLSL